MRFVKLQGAGNDFILYDNRTTGLSLDELSKLAALLCRRRFSLGADALMVVDPPAQGGQLRMTFLNSDGTIGEMCGNGARCLARWAWEQGLFRGDTVTIETAAGPVSAWRIDNDLYKVRLNRPSVFELDRIFPLNGAEHRASYVELGCPGVPHLVVECPAPAFASRAGLRPLAASLRAHPGLPKGANVDLYHVERPGQVRLLTFERGVEDFTLACGTGAGATALVLVRKGLAPSPVTLLCPGGELVVDIDGDDLYLTGPTAKVAEGEAFLR